MTKKSGIKIALYTILLLVVGVVIASFFVQEEELNLTPHTNYHAFNGIYDIDNQRALDIPELKIQDSILYWENSENVEYYISYHTNEIAPELITVEESDLDIKEISNKNEITIFRLGQKTDNTISFGNSVFYNPNNFGEYTKNIYFFDGIYADHYIESDNELNHVVHYNLINKSNNYRVKLSHDYASKLAIKYNSGDNIFSDALSNTMQNNIMETMYITYGSRQIKRQFNEYVIELNHHNVVNPNNKSIPEKVQDTASVPYYEKVDYIKRADDYDSFVTDNSIVVVDVSTSDQLYWAIEGDATPIFSNTNSVAYNIYNTAKSVLRDIISDSMTDYEKVLSIFDYITVNSVYDSSIVTKKGSADDPFTNYTAFYLEGIFFDNLAVCDGISKAFTLLTKMEGIYSTRIVGTINDLGHAWNKVYFDDNWYVVDATWTEITAESYLTGESTEFLAHKYFLVSDNEIKSHKPHISSAEKNKPIATNYRYYEKQNYTYDDVENRLIINTDDKAIRLLNYMWDNYLSKTNNLQQQTGAFVEQEFLISDSVFQNWRQIVKSAKLNYNLNNEHGLLFNNDVFIVIEDNFKVPYKDGMFNNNGKIAIVQIHNTFKNMTD